MPRLTWPYALSNVEGKAARPVRSWSGLWSLLRLPTSTSQWRAASVVT
jgi:hypothetical protein